MEISRGEITRTVYTLIKEEKHTEAVEILQQLLELQPSNRSALSLLGYCAFQLQNFESAVEIYEKLSTLYPEIPEYQYYFAQSLYHSNSYEEALNASYLRGDPDEELKDKVVKLQAAIQYCRDETADAKDLLDNCSHVDAFTEVGKGCLAFKEGDYTAASQHFEAAANIVGPEPLLLYNRAVTVFQNGDMPCAAHFIGEIIENGVVQYPELCVGGQGDKECMTSVGNTRTLYKTAMIEALNLKAAIEFNLEKPKAARESMEDLPPRSDEEIDPISLHNIALLNMDTDPLEGLKKLRFLLDQTTFPPETFQNLLILYCRYDQCDLVADLLAFYQEYKQKYLTHDMGNFFIALTKRESAPLEALKMLDELAIGLAETLRKLVKKVDTTTTIADENETKVICNSFDELVTRIYLPTLMAIGKIHWDLEDLNHVEKTLRQGAEFLDDRDAWLTNVAHVVYHRGEDYAEAAGLYELIVRKHQKALLDVSAMTLANLCVSYVLIARNEEAERLLRNIEIQETELLEKCPGVKIYHSCIMNLVIGTLYCFKKNFEFGVSRILKSMDEMDTKLGPDTWYYTKRCFMGLMEKMVRNNVTVSRSLLDECSHFLKKCEAMGRNITTVIEERNVLPKANIEQVPINYGMRTVTYEARYIRYLIAQYVYMEAGLD